MNRMRNILFLLLLTGNFIIVNAQGEAMNSGETTIPVAPANFKVVGYVPNGIDLVTYSDSIDYDKLTHIYIAFENPDPEGNLSLAPGDTVLIRKAHANGVKVLVSIGGGAESGDSIVRSRYFRLISDGNRGEFISKIARYIHIHNFDGIDVDLEGPAINEDYGSFIRDLSDSLRPAGKLVTAALSRGYGGNKVKDETLQYFDFVNIMAYDATGPWNKKNTGQHSSYALAVSHLKSWKARGIARENAILGVPFYGFGFKRDYSYHGWTYADLVREYKNAEKKDKVGRTIYYNGIPTIKRKTRLAIEEGGGIMIWELSCDAHGPESLLLAIDQVVRGEDTKKSRFQVVKLKKVRL